MGNLRVSQHPARRWTCILLLAALCATPAVAQTAPTTSAPVRVETANFLASLAPANDLTPAPSFLQTTANGCTSDAQCLPDKLCCRDCGFFGCTHKGCLTPINSKCPLIP
jgi:hypothetical protein